MKREYQNKLISQYPQMFVKDWENPSLFQRIKNYLLFSIVGRSIPYPKIYNTFIFECGDGWKGILYELINKIKVLDRKTGVVTQVAQVKEKFGGLRFYPLNGVSNEVWKLIMEYEKKSYGVCEFTGSRNNVGMWTYRWMSNMSRKYAEEHYERRKREGDIPNGLTLEDCWIPNPITDLNVVIKQKTI
jgi:hypothetical protein